MKKKYYVLQAVIDGQQINFDREFDSRNSAMNYIYGYCKEHFQNIPVINEECQVGDDKHDIEYEIDYFNRFRISRVIR